MQNIAIFASGNGTNFESLARAIETGFIPANLVLLVCNKKDAYVIERAKKRQIETLVVSLKASGSKEKYETIILEKLQSLKVDWIVLAGYMLFCGPTLLKAYPNRIINIHPALLPAFPGAHGIQDAYAYGVKVFGVTVHYVDAGVDTGKIIDQASFHSNPDATLEEIEAQIHAIEHELYPRTIRKLIQGEEQ